MAVASLVLGILSLIFMSPLFAFIGLILGIKSNKKLKEENQPAGVAIGGIITSSIGLIISSLMFLLLIAVAVPKFSIAINKARASEAPMYLNQISSAEAVYEAETENYFQPANAQEITDSLGVLLQSDFFDYTIEVNEKGFIAKATIKQELGKASIGEYLWIDQDENKGIEGDELKKLVRVWGSSYGNYNRY